MRAPSFCGAILIAGVMLTGCVRHQTSFREPPPDSYSAARLDLALDAATTQVQVAEVTADFFQSDAPPIMGRVLVGDEFTRAEPAVTVLSHQCWRERFVSSPTILGERVILDGRPTTIVGVAPPGFDVPKGTCFWLPRRQR